MFILEAGDQYGFSPKADEIISPVYDKLNYEGQDDVDFDAYSRLVFLDALMCTGKTHVAQQYFNRHPHSSVLAVTFRISLAKYLSTRLFLNCYLICL